VDRGSGGQTRLTSEAEHCFSDQVKLAGGSYQKGGDGSKHNFSIFPDSLG